MYERDNELSTLAELLDAADRGSGSVALLTGAAASGKTALLTHFSDQAAAHGALLLDASGAQAEQPLPFALAGKLLDGSPQPPHRRAELRRRMDAAAAESSAEAQIRILPGLAGAVLELAEEQPVLVAVDDCHFGDEASLQFLLALARRARRARVLLVLSATSCLHPDQMSLVGELLRQAHCHRLRLKPLSADGTRRMLADHAARAGHPTHTGPYSTTQLATALHEQTGGNPLLTRALLDDHAAATEAGEAAATPGSGGENWANAVAETLHRCGPEASAIARGTAVLGADTRPALLRRLVELPPKTVESASRALTLSGLFCNGTFRDAPAAHAVLAATPQAEVGRLHLRAAELLRNDGASASEVARHVVCTHERAERWAVPVLHEAAEYAVADGDLDFARRCLELAQESCPDGPERTALKMRLADVLWRSNPSALAEHLSTLVPEMTGERLSPGELVVTVGYLVWLRRVDEAARVLDTLEQSGTWSGPEQLAALAAARQWLGMLSPAHRTGPTGDRAAAPDDPGTSEPLGGTADIAHQRAASAVAAALSGGSTDSAVSQATRVLQRYGLGDGYVQPLMFALWALIYAGRTDLALPWCERLLAECKDRHGPTWRGLLTAVRAEIALRQGDLAKAARQAEESLTLLSRQDWCVAVYFPLSTLINAHTGMGRYDDALELLNHAAPDARLHTLPELHFRHARGRWYLATGRYHAALGDFVGCGELLEQWGIDAPELAPWRIDAADAWLALGEREKAAQLAKDQLSRSPGRARGAALRALGSARNGRGDLGALEESVRILEHGGDRLQLARALGELGRGYQAEGDVHRARMLAQKAWHMAKFCGAEPLCRQLIPAHGDQDGAPDVTEQHKSSPGSAEALTEAEGRVAVLAAHGHTNREIAAKLYVTVSTVEQHLTRIYRKLRVQRRRDLPTTLSTRASTLRLEL